MVKKPEIMDGVPEEPAMKITGESVYDLLYNSSNNQFEMKIPNENMTLELGDFVRVDLESLKFAVHPEPAELYQVVLIQEVPSKTLPHSENRVFPDYKIKLKPWR